jgi:ATP-dependent HslUV protease subunit HslV
VSTVTVVKKNGYVAIAADTLASYGPLKMSAVYSRTNHKIAVIGQSYLGMTGWAVSQQVLEHVFRSVSEPPAFANTTEIFEVFQLLHARLKEQYYLVPRADPGDAFEISHMHALIANPHGIFSVGSMRTVTEHDRFWGSGSGIEYALGAMHALYDVSNDVVAIAEAGVRAAVEFDTATGMPIESHVVRLAAEPVEELELLLKM